MPQPAELLPELERIARQAGDRALAAQPGTPREIKPDGSIVTPSDREAEAYIREELVKLIPGAGIYGEEMASTAETPDGLWCIDPIDGTSNYAFGSPIWGVSIGLVRGEQALAGAVYLPALGEMYLAACGSGATFNGVPIDPIPAGSIRDEELVSCPDRILRRYRADDLPGKLRHTGAFVADAVFTVTQRYRGLIGLREKLYDIAACLCLAHEVAAEIRYADGSELLLGPLKHPSTRLEKSWLIFPRDSGVILR